VGIFRVLNEHLNFSVQFSLGFPMKGSARMPRGKARTFSQMIGAAWQGLTGKTSPPDPAPSLSAPDQRSFKERLDARFEDMMQEVDELSNERYSPEEHMEYGFISFVRAGLPIVFFLAFGYEDGLFMTGFRDFTLVTSIIIMYVIGYGLEGLRTSLVYSMSFSRTEGRQRAFRQQFIFWIVMSVGCGVAQLASALVIQALGGDQSIPGESAIAVGAKTIMATMPWLIYVAIGLRVALCAVADWACSGFLHKKRKTVEQKVTEITTRASNLGTIVQANLNAQSMIDNARQFQDMVRDQNVELKELRGQQKTVFDTVFRAGMQQVNRIVEMPNLPEIPGPDE
jgi:hypothetical protein